MPTQIKTLVKLEISNIFGLNVLLHTKDKKARRVKLFLAGTLVLLALAFAGYMGGMCYGLIQLGLEDIVFAYLTVFTSILILALDLFKAGNLIFQKNGYEMIASLPLSQTAIVFGRFVRIYMENMLLTAVVFLTEMGVYGAVVKPGWAFYAMGIVGMLLVPLIPLSVAVFVGALIKAVSSRMKHKSMVEILLMLAIILGMLVLTYGFGEAVTTMDAEAMEELMKNLSTDFYAMLEKVYLPAVWMGRALAQDRFGEWLLFAGVSLVVAGLAMGISSFRFHAICRNLVGTSARHNYRMQAQSQDSLLISLCKRELKRYVSSGIYVTNTIIGPIMATAVAVGILIAGMPKIPDDFPLALNLQGAFPFLLAMIFCMMNPSCVSISIEGKTWWIVKTLPIEAGTILDAKMLTGLIIYAPFYLASEILSLIALRPGMSDAFWLIVAPMLFIVFGAVFGIAVNLRLPVFQWEDEVSVVKQSASAAIGGIGGALIGFVCMAVVAVVPEEYSSAAKAVICAVILAVTMVLYRKNAAADLREIG